MVYEEGYLEKNCTDVPEFFPNIEMWLCGCRILKKDNNVGGWFFLEEILGFTIAQNIYGGYQEKNWFAGWSVERILLGFVNEKIVCLRTVICYLGGFLVRSTALGDASNQAVKLWLE